jgi:hypothetical protein
MQTEQRATSISSLSIDMARLPELEVVNSCDIKGAMAHVSKAVGSRQRNAV